MIVQAFDIQSRYLIWNILIFARETLVSELSHIFQHGTPELIHPTNQHPSYDRYAEMTHFVLIIPTANPNIPY